MTNYTRLGAQIWNWEPWTELPPVARLLWMSLYTSAEARRVVPGLFVGSITAMSEIARLPVDDTLTALDQLLEHEMAEYDQKLRVLRLTRLPDCGESPPNPNCVRSWWIRFQTVPACPVRDAHVATLRWTMDEWSRENGRPVTAAHEAAWTATFAMVAVPAPRRRGVRRLVDHATGTEFQRGLFDPPPPPPPVPSPIEVPISPVAVRTAHVDPLSSGASEARGTVPGPTYPQGGEGGVDNSDPLRQNMKYQVSGNGIGNGYRNGMDQDQDQDQDLGSSFRSASGGGSGGHDSGKPALTLVPPPGSCSPQEFVSLLGLGRQTVPQDAHAAICATIAAIDARGWGPRETLLAQRSLASRRHEMAWPDTPPDERLAYWCTTTSRVVSLFELALEHERVSKLKLEAHRESMRALGMARE